MSEKQELDRNQIWMIILIAIPASMLMNLGQSFAPDGDMNQSLYSGLFAGLGGLLGLFTHALTKNGPTAGKIIGAAFLLVACGIVLMIVNS
ncbi:MAG: hypothetical protein AAF927_23630 [Bacteroidota bacterium]